MDTSKDLRAILGVARGLGASDIHIVPGEAPHYRIGRKLAKTDDGFVLEMGDVERLIKPYVSEEFWKKTEKHDGEAVIDVAEGGRIRATVYRSNGKLGATMRVFQDRLPSLERYSFAGDLDKLLVAERGLILICGPGVTGKTSMAASLIDRINMNYAKHIITLEDPVEIKISSGKGIVRQRTIGVDVSSWEEGMRNVLREDADVVYVSEIRTMDSMAGILTLAEVRCLVIATLHTLNPRHTVERVVDIFPLSARGPIRKQLAAVLLGMVTMSRDNEGKITARLCLIEETTREAIRMDDLERLE